MTWPFGCRGCKSKDSEIAFLRGQFASMRTVYKTPVHDAALPIVEQAVAMNSAPADTEDDDRPLIAPGSFYRDPVQDFDPTKDDR